ncbi:CD209 antigen-like protein E, partial [Stylophora pistillata]
MEKVRFAVYSTLLVLTGTTQTKSDGGLLRSYADSSYIFYGSNGTLYSWDKSRTSCESSGCNLVSIESREEWKFLKETMQNNGTSEYFIGLRKDTSTGEWRWLSDNSTVNASSKGKWLPWAAGEPNNQGGENCAEMYNYENNFGCYNDLRCDVPKKGVGFICECKDGG